MPEHRTSTPRRPSRAIIAISVAAALALVGAGISVALMLPTNPASSPTAQSPAPSADRESPLSPGEAEGAGVLSTRNAKSIVSTAVNIKTTESKDADALKKKLAGVVGGAYLAELQAQQQELEAYGWKITGDVSVVSVDVGKVDTSRSRAKVKVKACIDTAGTKTVDSEGKALPKAPGATRAMNIFTLAQNADGTWAVIRHTFPNDPTC